MSIQEIIEAVRQLPPDQLRQFEAEYDRVRHSAGGDGAQSNDAAPTEQEALAAYREKLAAAARPYWSGVDGLDYQMRIRAEWDDRPGWDD